jgi:tRNA(Ile)-lysidine synthase TilS/MesJ
MAAKKRMIQNEEESGEEEGRISGEEWTNGIGQKCILEMNKTIGNSMKALYERMERKALKCAEQSFVKPKKALNPNQVCWEGIIAPSAV